METGEFYAAILSEVGEFAPEFLDFPRFVRLLKGLFTFPFENFFVDGRVLRIFQYKRELIGRQLFAAQNFPMFS